MSADKLTVIYRQCVFPVKIGNVKTCLQITMAHVGIRLDTHGWDLYNYDDKSKH